ncbi:type II toxin-antitoxin system PemK/MazF family toxin [Actinomyces lilanjuaniae]|uniref:Type II toxin-antitoxin system PemK/MazF family toxin n=1 Tax=Actinomyces lilanjuaniae TaxID=2321394 RepID=A0ABN5PSK2_9ACTO|nr:type II toxin-antitoxin system PemK/MazF family toxin [Actinomyces lilanjuaniae]AYD90894.1 type II toxin-antitoxin system PemK/MazF family toxin [Actinomyces lilanjuaniae]
MPSLLTRVLGLLGPVVTAAADSLAADKTGSRTGRSDRRAASACPSTAAPPASDCLSRATVWDVARNGLPSFAYTPSPDGRADPGEVVWAWVPYEEDPSQGKDRPVLVLARSDARLVVAQMTSRDHDADAAQEARWGRYWYDVGTGAWDGKGRPSEVRLDRLLSVDPAAVRREGATMEQAVFDGVVTALKQHWS